MPTVPEQMEALKQGLDDLLVECVEESYAAWHERRRYLPRAPEPRLGVGYFVDYLDQSQYHGYWYRDELRSLVRSALRRLYRQGRLSRSCGLGDGGQEAYLYEPAQKG